MALNWIERLNAQSAPGNCGARVLRWHYSSELSDNVPHRHTFFEICLVGRSGKALWSVRDQHFFIQAGDLILARPGVIHQISQTQQLELFWVSFDVQTGALQSEIIDLWRAFESSDCVLARDDGTMLKLWLALEQLASSEEIAGKSLQIAALQGAILLAIAQIGAAGLVPPSEVPQADVHHSARLAARYLMDNLGRKITLEEVANHVHLSPRHLSRVFAAFTGVSPALYLETARLDRARHQLRSSNRTIKEIAAGVGFEDVHYFHRLFSKRNGTSPAQYRRESKNGVQIVHKDGALV